MLSGIWHLRSGRAGHFLFCSYSVVSTRLLLLATCLPFHKVIVIACNYSYMLLQKGLRIQNALWKSAEQLKYSLQSWAWVKFVHKAKCSLLYSEFPETKSSISHRSCLRTATFCSSDLESIQKLTRSWVLFTVVQPPCETSDFFDLL